MNVSYADILSAYILTFGTDMNPHNSFASAANEIKAARADWLEVFRACEDARMDMQRAGVQYPDYAEVATRAQAEMAAGPKSYCVNLYKHDGTIVVGAIGKFASDKAARVGADLYLKANSKRFARWGDMQAA